MKSELKKEYWEFLPSQYKEKEFSDDFNVYETRFDNYAKQWEDMPQSVKEKNFQNDFVNLLNLYFQQKNKPAQNKKLVVNFDKDDNYEACEGCSA